MNIKMRPLTDEDWPDFCRFGKQHFGNSHNIDPAFNQHWFKRNGIAPDIDTKLEGWTGLVLESPDGSMIGVMVVIVIRAWFAGESIPLAWISTGVVDDEAKALGGGASLYYWIYRNFPLVGALSGNEYSHPINALMGRDIPDVSMRRFLFVHDPKASALCLPEQRNALDGLTFIAKTDIRPRLHWRWTRNIPDGYQQIWEKFRATVICTTDRTPEHLRWRFMQAPYVDYRFLELWDETMLRGIAVIRYQDTPKGLVCRIVDFIADPYFSSACWIATAAACAEAGALFCDFHVIGTSQDAALNAAGFLTPDTVPQLKALPNLLSPVDHREWTNSFHMGGSSAMRDQSWRSPEAVYFTKADSDRDWPTPYVLKMLKEQPTPEQL